MLDGNETHQPEEAELKEQTVKMMQQELKFNSSTLKQYPVVCTALMHGRQRWDSRGGVLGGGVSSQIWTRVSPSSWRV